MCISVKVGGKRFQQKEDTMHRNCVHWYIDTLCYVKIKVAIVTVVVVEAVVPVVSMKCQQ